MFIILGYLVIILAAVLQAYCEFGRQARPDIQPKILKSGFRFVMEGLWIFLLIIASVALFLNGWVMALIGIVAFWLVLPFLITPIMRNRILPPWDEVKKELEPKGYNQRDYWRGSWWMKESKEKRRKH
jgi:ABC-type multidrug transport system fused ATPase/permease subunit